MSIYDVFSGGNRPFDKEEKAAARQEQRKAAQQPMEQEVPELPAGRIAPHPAVPLQIAVRHPLRM